MGTHVDVTERKRAEEERDRLRKLEAELAHINRVSMLGELAGSLGHEIKQPIAAAVTNANACLRWLKRDRPDLEEAQEAAARMVEDAMRAVQLQQVLMNLLINGIDAIDGMRGITISSKSAAGDKLLVAVSDTGVGLPPETNQIFDAFFTTKAHGTGMGLAISRTIIESHGGRLSATSNASRGATFYFTLPGVNGIPA